MSSSPAILRHLLDRRVLGAVIGALSGVVATYHGWPGGLALFVTRLGMLFAAQWMERDIQRVGRRLKESADTAP